MPIVRFCGKALLAHTEVQDAVPGGAHGVGALSDDDTVSGDDDLLNEVTPHRVDFRNNLTALYPCRDGRPHGENATRSGEEPEGA